MQTLLKNKPLILKIIRILLLFLEIKTTDVAKIDLI